MQLARELDDLVTELWESHPRFPRATVARLVARTADVYRRNWPDESAALLIPLVRQVAEEQLQYADSQPV